MLKKTVTATGLIFFVLYLLSAVKAAADVVADPVRLYGLGEIRAITVSPDKRFMATGGQGGVFLWDFATGEFVERLDIDWWATALAFSPDSKVLIGATGPTIVSWNSETGGRIREFAGHSGEINSLVFANDGKSFVSISADNTARVWSIDTGEELHSVRTPGSPITDVAISPDGTKLATIDTFLTNSVKVWDIASETQIGYVPKTNWTAYRVEFTPTGELITSVSDRSIALWNISSEAAKPVRSFTGITNPIAFILDIWFPDAATMAGVCNDGNVFRWNLATGELLGVTTGEHVFAAIGLPGELVTVGANMDYVVRARELPSGNQIREFIGHTTSVHTGVAFSPDGKYVLSGGTEAATRLWNRKTGAPARHFVGGGAGTEVVKFSPDGSNVLTTIGLPNPAAQLWNVESGELVREFKWTEKWPMGAAFSKDGTKLATRAQDQGIRIFDVATGGLIRTIPSIGWGGAVAFSPIAPLLASAGANDAANLHNHETGQLLETFSSNFGPVTATEFSPEGNTLSVAWQDGFIRLYDPVTFEVKKEFFVNGGFLNAAIFSPDGQFILTGEGWPAFVAEIFDAQTGALLRQFAGHKYEVGGVACSADGASVLTGAEIVREWSIHDLAGRLKIETNGDQRRIAWGLGILEQANNPAGPWETLPDATSPFTLDLNGAGKFFRVNVTAFSAE